MNRREEVIRLVEDSGLSCAEEILNTLRPSLRIYAEQGEIAAMPVGASRMGGMPDLPDEIAWPSWLPPKARDNRRKALDFIAQINLEEVCNFDLGHNLPEEGMLYFFYDIENFTWGYDPNDRGSSRVIFFKGPMEKLKRRLAPGVSPDTHACMLSFEQDWTVKDTFDIEVDEIDSFECLVDELQGDSETIHRLFGQPQTIQDDMEVECQLVTNGIYCGTAEGYDSEEAKDFIAGADDWRLLLQVDTDEDNPGWMWGDCGRLYFWIKESDLDNLNFDNTWLISQCF